MPVAIGIEKIYVWKTPECPVEMKEGLRMKRKRHCWVLHQRIHPMKNVLNRQDLKIPDKEDYYLGDQEQMRAIYPQRERTLLDSVNLDGRQKPFSYTET